MKVGSALVGGVRRLRGAARAGGADKSGLAPLLELIFVSAAGDALVTVCLAGSQFLSVKPGEARSNVALYLLITMAPFALLAPVIGPLLDRFASGRRIALGVTMLARGALALTLGRHIHDTGTESLVIYPLALALLMLSRAFGVARSAVVPRVLPEELTLVKVNSRVTLTGVAAGIIVAPIGLGIAKLIDYTWTLRLAAVVFFGGLFLAWVLPSQVDSDAGERAARKLARAVVVPGQASRWRRMLGDLPAALRSATAMRALVGFLTLFLAFQAQNSKGNKLVAYAMLGAAASVGSGLGVFLGGRLRKSKPEVLLVLGLVASIAACTVATVLAAQLLALLAALICTAASSMGKLGLDAVIQRDIPEDTRNSAFARSETALQLSWVLGGAVGIIPFPGTTATQQRLGFLLATAGIGAALVAELLSLRRSRQDRLHGRVSRTRSSPATASPVAAEPTTEWYPETGPPGARLAEPPPSTPATTSTRAAESNGSTWHGPPGSWPPSAPPEPPVAPRTPPRSAPPPPPPPPPVTEPIYTGDARWATQTDPPTQPLPPVRYRRRGWRSRER